jgi:hypothetical protein
MKMKGFPQRLPAAAQMFADAKSDMAFINELTAKDIREDKLIPLGTQSAQLPPTVLVWGDSHAMAALPAIEELLVEKKLAGRAVTHSSTAPVLGWFKVTRWGLGKDSIPFNEAVLTYAQQKHIPNVILIAHWNDYAKGDAADGGSAQDDTAQEFDAALLTTVKRLVAIGARPWILLDVPNQPFNVPKALSRTVHAPEQLEALCARPAPRNELQGGDPQIMAEIQAAGGRVIDPKPAFLDATKRYYRVQVNKTALYRDEEHLTVKGAKLMLLPLLRTQLKLTTARGGASS